MMIGVNHKGEYDPLYPERDYAIIDYHPYSLAGLRFRGPDPRPLKEEEYITFIGSAHTYGPYCEDPYPHLIRRRLGIKILNLGYGGVGPSFFNRHQELIRYANQGRLVVLQVMSARCESNSRLISNGSVVVFDKKRGQWVRAEEAWARLLAGDWSFLSYAQRFPFSFILQRVCALISEKSEYIQLLIRETQKNWMEQYTKLIRQLRVPVVLFWFSTRSPSYVEPLGSLKLGSFPHFVSREMVSELAKLCNAYVECVTGEGLPQKLYNRFTGKRVYITSRRLGLRVFDPRWFVQLYLSSINRYYPSPEMHKRAAEALEPTIRGILGIRG